MTTDRIQGHGERLLGHFLEESNHVLRKLLYGILLGTLFACHLVARGQPSLNFLAIEVTGESREIAYTNKQSAFFYGETNGENRSSWQGFNVYGHEVIDDYALLIDGKPLSRADVLKAVVYPDFLVRYYPNDIREEVRIIDSLAMFAISVTSPSPVELSIIPYFTEGRKSTDYEIVLENHLVLLARVAHLQGNLPSPAPLWLSIHGEGFIPSLKESKDKNQFSPVLLHARRMKGHTVVFAVGRTADEAKSLAVGYPAKSTRYHAARRWRMERLLNLTKVETQDKRFDIALAWAKLSLDALIMNQGTKGIFAGLPWFNNYWGRDTFISLPGATLVTGQFHEARQILRAFAEFQQRDSASSNYGRIPNIVTTTEKAYNTADGTPRFVIMAREYVERSGDTAFIREIYPTVLRSIEGTLRSHTDSFGFLTHGDAETWMDAVGPNGPWSPRGNRANDVQALWAGQLEAGAWFADQVGDSNSALLWMSQRKKLQSSFHKQFIVNGRVVDHLNPDGSHDQQLRPNQIFVSPLLGQTRWASVLRSVVESLTYEYGVASLSHDDENFHPYHEYPPFYPKDAAYHNGTVWTWLQGPLISGLCSFGQQDFAYRLTSNTVHQILDRGAVGTQSELLDAVPMEGEKEPRLSGTFSQAWNLAEFIRNFYDDYLGVRVDRFKHELWLRPHLPKRLGNVRAAINLGGRSVPIAVTRSDSASTEYVIDASNLRVGGTGHINFQTASGNAYGARFPLKPGESVTVSVRDSTTLVSANGDPPRDLTYRGFHAHPIARPDFRSMQFAIPKIKPELKALKGPAYSLLNLEEVKKVNPKARIMCDVEDPQGDDDGGKGYTYPLNQAFVPGSFDITRFKAAYDSSYVYFVLRFRALSNPGWHPEYGFQLTYVAIAIDEDSQVALGEQLIGHNSNYSFVLDQSFKRLVLVGGGVQIEDDKGEILAAYVPGERDVVHPLGNADQSEISFSIPLEYLGSPNDRWTLTVLVGGQDDHGGAGLGEFRMVRETAVEWNGGGKLSESDPNIYDILVASVRTNK